jgi:hypothetical protein
LRLGIVFACYFTTAAYSTSKPFARSFSTFVNASSASERTSFQETNSSESVEICLGQGGW